MILIPEQRRIYVPIFLYGEVWDLVCTFVLKTSPKTVLSS